MKGQMMHYPLTTTAILEYGNRVFSHKEIITKLPDGSRHQYSFHDLYIRSKKLAHALVHQLNIKPGDKVATFAWNHYQHIELYYAIPGMGAVCHPLNIRLSGEQVEYIVNHAEDKVIFIDASLVPLFEKIAALTPMVQRFVLLNAPAGFVTTLPNTIHYEELLANASANFEWMAVDENDACAMCYTSGTTGAPKGVVYSHRSVYLHAQVLITPNAANISMWDRVLLVVPQFHVLGWGFPYVCVMAGTDMVMPSCHLQPAALINLIQQEKITIATGVPTIWLGIYESLKKDPPKEKLTLREYMVGGSALPLSLIRGLDQDFGIKGIHAWGMTETSPLGTGCRLQAIHNGLSKEDQYKILAKQGIELPGVEIRIIKEDGNPAPKDGETAGELQIRGAWVIDSYYKMEDNSAYFSADGWFKTGDVATMDTNGYLQITDRTKDLIKSGGEWISSVALEVALMGHPAVSEACVIAIPDALWQERPLACIVLRAGSTVSTENFREFLIKDFAPYQVPEQYIPMAQIPKTSVGKFDKRELRRMYAAGELG
jgi:fatty-acyl-CoA synthase